jgi:hypothetical protein
MAEFAHQSGKPITCLCMALKIHKQQETDHFGNSIYKIGMSIGGGIDQDHKKSIYDDNVSIDPLYNKLINGEIIFKFTKGIYVTHVEPNSPADEAGLKVHDKLLQVNGIDYVSCIVFYS